MESILDGVSLEQIFNDDTDYISNEELVVDDPNRYIYETAELVSTVESLMKNAHNGIYDEVFPGVRTARKRVSEWKNFIRKVIKTITEIITKIYTYISAFLHSVINRKKSIQKAIKADDMSSYKLESYTNYTSKFSNKEDTYRLVVDRINNAMREASDGIKEQYSMLNSMNKNNDLATMASDYIRKFQDFMNKANDSIRSDIEFIKSITSDEMISGIDWKSYCKHIGFDSIDDVNVKEPMKIRKEIGKFSKEVKVFRKRIDNVIDYDIDTDYDDEIDESDDPIHDSEIIDSYIDMISMMVRSTNDRIGSLDRMVLTLISIQNEYMSNINIALHKGGKNVQ